MAKTIRARLLDDLVKLLQGLIDKGALVWVVVIAVLWVVAPHIKSILEGISGFIAEQKRVDADIRRTDDEVAQAAERRRERAAKKKVQAPAPPALPAPNEQLLLPPATETQSRTRVSARRRR